MINPESKLAKGVTALSLATTIGLGLSACGGEEGPATTNNDTEPSHSQKYSGIDEAKANLICDDPQIKDYVEQINSKRPEECRVDDSPEDTTPGTEVYFEDPYTPFPVIRVISHAKPGQKEKGIQVANEATNSDPNIKWTTGEREFEHNGYDCQINTWTNKEYNMAVEKLQCAIGDSIAEVNIVSHKNNPDPKAAQDPSMNIIDRITEVIGTK